MSVSANECAREVLETAPLLTRTIRKHMRSQSEHGLSVPQFRTLAFISRHEGASPSAIADHIGLALPSVTKLLDGLVERNLVIRQSHPVDRRRLVLLLTPTGYSTLQAARSATQAYLGDRLAGLDPGERETVCAAMQILRPLFASMRQSTLVSER
jgi:DNA-binding MarR family transcriptional regulator